MQFDWLRLRFAFTAVERVEFPPVLAANILRGALGVLSRRLVCDADCPGARTCPARNTCLYARVFEPSPTWNVPSGLADLPRPFVFRARNLDGRTLQQDEDFGFDMHLFSADPAMVEHLRQTFASLQLYGLGPTRGKVVLREMTVEPQSADLEPTGELDRVQIVFATPTELKAGGRLVLSPDFPALFGRIRDRISTLRALYGERPLPVDFRALGDKAEKIRMTSWELAQQQIVSRYSSRTGQTHPLGGFTGTATYEGELGEFLPWLQAAQATGVGRQAVWGKGEILISH